MNGKAFVVAALTMLLLAGCGQKGPVGFAYRPERAEPGVWVATGDRSATLIQIVRADAELSGTLDSVEVSDSDPTEVETTHAAFTGTVDGTRVALTFPLGLGFVTSLTGTWTDVEMRLDVPNDDGTMGTFALYPSSRAAYNRAATTVNAAAVENARAEASSSAVAADRAARLDAERRVADAARRVDEAVGRVSGAARSGPAFDRFEAALASAKEAVAGAQRHADEAAAEPDEYAACSYAYAARSAAYTAESAGYDGDSAAGDVDAKATEVNDLITAVGKTLSDYRAAKAAVPDYFPPGVPDEAAIQRILDEAAKQAKAWRDRAADYQRRIGEQVKQAKAVADKAEGQFC